MLFYWRRKQMKDNSLLMPKYRFRSVLDITPADLQKMGAKAVGLDIDNTLAPDGTMKFIDGAEEWVQSIRAAGFPIMLISNGTILRVRPIAKRFALPYVSLSMKPFANGLRRAAKRMQVELPALAMLGDQLFSDVKAANRCGAIPVRIDPIPMKSLYPHYYAWKEKRERPILEAFEKQHGYGVYDD